ncbi:hypothetical protein WDZ16_01820 [Pseudokineococcus marinus]|uniref:hypothetical protein n=1 Tax=Pseudokineococcus marinus TaxID=351215 RepID=UPI001BB2EAF9|nr:hypothetical protein [Pseudokineococcus marinus]
MRVAQAAQVLVLGEVAARGEALVPGGSTPGERAVLARSRAGDGRGELAWVLGVHPATAARRQATVAFVTGSGLPAQRVARTGGRGAGRSDAPARPDEPGRPDEPDPEPDRRSGAVDVVEPGAADEVRLARDRGSRHARPTDASRGPDPSCPPDESLPPETPDLPGGSGRTHLPTAPGESSPTQRADGDDP